MNYQSRVKRKKQSIEIQIDDFLPQPEIYEV
jgi:hypothetical protein